MTERGEERSRRGIERESKHFGACALSALVGQEGGKKLTPTPPKRKKTVETTQSGVWDLLYGNLDEASVAEHGGGSGGGGGFSASGKNHALADPSRYPYSAVGALFAYRETDPLSGSPRAPPPLPSFPPTAART